MALDSVATRDAPRLIDVRAQRSSRKAPRSRSCITSVSCTNARSLMPVPYPPPEKLPVVMCHIEGCCYRRHSTRMCQPICQQHERQKCHACSTDSVGSTSRSISGASHSSTRGTAIPIHASAAAGHRLLLPIEIQRGRRAPLSSRRPVLFRLSPTTQRETWPSR